MLTFVSTKKTPKHNPNHEETTQTEFMIVLQLLTALVSSVLT